jgi:hypothetical protein
VLDPRAIQKAARLYWGVADAKMSGAALTSGKAGGNLAAKPEAPAPIEQVPDYPTHAVTANVATASVATPSVATLMEIVGVPGEP